MLKPGVRVVRGPNWSWENQDGGEGYAGTVSRIGTSESPDKTVVIQWDNGNRTICRVGYVDKYDLRIIDNAQIGVSHPRVTCDSCNCQHIYGIRYKCNSCYDFDLCYICYHGDKHDLGHSFKRLESEKAMGINLPPRLNGRKCELKGIFAGAIVVRGFDWDWGNQDGGEGKHGIVLDIRGWEKKSRRSTANIKWFSANTDIYRIGYKGYCDIKFVESASGGHYYPEHLPILGQTEEEMEWNQIIDAIDLQQVMEMENRENNPGKSQVEQREEIERIYPTLSYLGSIESAYASVVMHYNNSFNKNSGKIDLVDEFFRLPNEFKVKEMWEIVKYMTQMPSVSKFYSIVKNDVVKTRNTNTFIDELVVQGNRYLEDRFKIYMTNKINNGNLPSVAQDDVTSTFRLVHGFVSVRLRGEYVGLQDGLIHGCPLWPMVYYCLRAGDLSAAIYCLTNNCLPEFQDVISLLECKLKNPSSPHFRMFKKNIKRLYTTNVRNSTDPFKRSAWAILGGLDEISEIAKTADDYLWVKLNMVQMDQESGCIRYKNLQHTILEEHGESHYDAFKQPLLYFKLLALTGQFEAAIDFLFRTDNFRVHAVHMAIALCELNLLVSPQDTSLPLISIDPSDAKPVHRLNFALLIKSYVEKFDAECLREALHYLFLLRHCKNLEGQHLFKISVTDLTIKTKACEKIFGKVQRDGIIKGLLDEFTDAKMFAEDVGQDLVKRDLYEEAIDLYDGVNIQYSLLTVMCKMLSKVANLENAPGSLRNKIQEKAIIVDQRFSREGCYVQDANIVNSFIKLKGLLPFFDLYREKRYPEALKAIYNLKIVPLRNAEVDERVKNLKNLLSEVWEVMPYVLLATMTILVAQCDQIKNTDGLMTEHLQCVWEQANCITNFTEMLPDVIPSDTRNRLVQMEILMHS